jgi:hypothetical protein
MMLAVGTIPVSGSGVPQTMLPLAASTRRSYRLADSILQNLVAL